MPPLESMHSVMHALCIRPDTRFADQRQGEEVLLTVRAHPITLLITYLNGFIIFFLLLVLNPFIVVLISPIQLVFINAFILFLISIYFWIISVTWYFNMGVVTNQQIIDVDFHPFGNKEITRTELIKIEDITARSSGFFSSIFNYGNVFIQTAGTEINTEFINIPNPGKVAYLIQEIKESYVHGK